MLVARRTLDVIACALLLPFSFSAAPSSKCLGDGNVEDDDDDEYVSSYLHLTVRANPSWSEPLVWRRFLPSTSLYFAVVIGSHPLS